jgi:hypothetical protein
MLPLVRRRQRMKQTPTLDIQPERDPLATIAASAAPVVLEGRYRLLMRSLWQLRHSRRTRWGVGLGSGAVMLVLTFLAARHFATTSWPLSRGQPGLLVAAGLLLLLAQALKALGWARLFTNRERPSPVALVAGNGGAALIGVVLPGRFDDAMRIAVVRRYPGCPAGLRAISLSLVMLGLIDSAALAPLAAVAVAFPGAGVGVRFALAVVAAAGIAAAAVIVALPRLTGSERALRFRLGRWLSPRTTSLYRATQAWEGHAPEVPAGRSCVCPRPVVVLEPPGVPLLSMPPASLRQPIADLLVQHSLRVSLGDTVTLIGTCARTHLVLLSN